VHSEAQVSCFIQEFSFLEEQPATGYRQYLLQALLFHCNGIAIHSAPIMSKVLLVHYSLVAANS